VPDVPRARYDLRVLAAIRRIIRFVDIHGKQLAAEHGVTGPQLVCLAKLVEAGPMTTKQLADMVFLSASTLVGILDRLEARGWARRERSTVDRRQVFVHATDAGRELVARAPSPLQEALSRSLARLDESEQIAIARTLEQVVDLMQATDVDAAPVLETGERLDATGGA
jgi:DNA-binding MarR family transcriptional regulator